MKGYTAHEPCSPPRPSLLTVKEQKYRTSSRMTSKIPTVLGKGQFSIFLPRRLDSECYVRSPVKVKAEMFLCPEQLGVGGHNLRTIPCSARAHKLTEDNQFDIVNVPIKIEAEVILSPGFNYSSETRKNLNGEEMKPQCTVRVIEPSQKPYEATENGSNIQVTHCSKSDKTKGVLVNELRLDDNTRRTKDLSRQINSYANQVVELNKKIQRLQERVRQEESKGASSDEKVHILEHQCRLMEQKLKAAECRAKVAERRAEAIKQRTKTLSISCGHQGVQLKDLTRHIELFVRNLETQTLQAIGRKEHQALKPRESINANDATTCSTPIPEGSNSGYTSRATKPFRQKNLSNDIDTNVRETTPDLNTPSKKCFYQTITMQELNDKYVLFLCRRSPKDQQSHRVALEPEEKPESMTSFERNKPSSMSSQSLALPPARAELLFNQYLQMTPNWSMEFDSSIQRAQELVQKCIVQALKLRNLSKDLDCFPRTTKRGDHSATSVSTASTSPCNLKGKVKFVEEDVTPSPESTPISETHGEHQALRLHAKVADQTNRCLERYLFNLAEAAETLVQNQKVQRIDAWIQTLPELPMVGLDLSRCSQQLIPQCQLVLKSWFPYKYEVKAWRIAFRSVVQAFLLGIGILLLPKVSLFQYLPPPT